MSLLKRETKIENEKLLRTKNQIFLEGWKRKIAIFIRIKKIFNKKKHLYPREFNSVGRDIAYYM